MGMRMRKGEYRISPGLGALLDEQDGKERIIREDSMYFLTSFFFKVLIVVMITYL